MYDIEQAVKITEKYRRTKYPFRQLGVGDSFTVAYWEGRRLRSAAYSHGKRVREWGFVIRRCDEGWRLWRVN
jgi:hypothetical protein